LGINLFKKEKRNIQILAENYYKTLIFDIMKNQRLLIIILLFIIPANIFSQTVLYHNLRISRTQPFLKSWNVDKKDVDPLHAVETVDAQNRVIEIRIYDGEVLHAPTCIITPIIKYEYKENMIIVHRYELENQYVSNVRCGQGQKTVYYLENGKIIRSVDFIVDFTAFEPNENSSDFYKQYFNEKIKIFEHGQEGKWKEIAGYGYSLRKMNGVNPTK